MPYPSQVTVYRATSGAHPLLTYPTPFPYVPGGPYAGGPARRIISGFLHSVPDGVFTMSLLSNSHLGTPWSGTAASQSDKAPLSTHRSQKPHSLPIMKTDHPLSLKVAPSLLPSPSQRSTFPPPFESKIMKKEKTDSIKW